MKSFYCVPKSRGTNLKYSPSIMYTKAVMLCVKFVCSANKEDWTAAGNVFLFYPSFSPSSSQTAHIDKFLSNVSKVLLKYIVIVCVFCNIYTYVFSRFPVLNHLHTATRTRPVVSLRKQYPSDLEENVYHAMSSYLYSYVVWVYLKPFLTTF